jgi:glucuronate isomerase
MNPDFSFSSDPAVRKVARELFEGVSELPIYSPHGHVSPALFSDPQASFGSPVDLFILPDHYITRVLYAHGISMEELGIRRVDGREVEKDHRKIWHLFCDNYFLFRGMPAGIWLQLELERVFDIHEKPAPETADKLYDTIVEKLATPQFSPRALYERFKIKVLCTTDAASDSLLHHQKIQDSGWQGRILPTFRPDGVVKLDHPAWRANIEALSAASGVDIVNYRSYIIALERQREFFKNMGAVASDHDVPAPATEELTSSEADSIFQRALQGKPLPGDASRFTAHMLIEMARMSCEDGLVMQMHSGVWRNHNDYLYRHYGTDRGGDVPKQVEFTANLLPLLQKYGNEKRMTLVLFTLDESTYTREIAPLAGCYPALKIGPPWWFHDSLNGMARYFDQVLESAGLYNTVGFNDDTRAFCSIPARHELWRRACANWVAGLVTRHIIDQADAREMMLALAVGLAQKTYHL